MQAIEIVWANIFG